MKKLREMFYAIAPIKAKDKITAGNFEKLLNKFQYLKNTGLSSPDMNLIFQKCCRSDKFGDFLLFLTMVERLFKILKEKGAISDETLSDFIH